MESLPSPPPCPHTVTVRRNPFRRARATPSSAIPLREPLNSPVISYNKPSENLNNSKNVASSTTPTENLKVYLRIRPMHIQKNAKNTVEVKNAWPKTQKSKINLKETKPKKPGLVCVHINDDLRSVTVSTPKDLQETKRVRSDVYEGFSRVFSSEASQNDVFEEMVRPLVDDFLNGKSGMLAAMGPSGSGKTYTVFGFSRNPGMVPLALSRIFSKEESNDASVSRVLYLSMFEICTEKGKGERIVDLLHSGVDICLQNSVLKGLQEVAISDAQQAESLIERGMMKRATAMTNVNSQSSRSQCIINIRHCPNKGGEEIDCEASGTMLTIVDLAGAEREKNTGNQNTRLLESNFINNTSMVFGLCLRSLLEHQKNRNKPLQKHYQSSLLTRYLRDYLEGKKRMMLILTVKPGEEDYNHTSFLLRQSSPFTKIKFENLEERVQLTPNKRPNKAFPRMEQPKKMKFSNIESLKNSEGNLDGGSRFARHKEIAVELLKDVPNLETGDFDNESLTGVHILSDGSEIGTRLNVKFDHDEKKTANDRQYQVMRDFAKALLTVLKQYKSKLEIVKIDNSHLRENLTNVQKKAMDLETELICEKARRSEMEKELDNFKSRCMCSMKASVAVSPRSSDDAISQGQIPEQQELNSVASPFSSKVLEQLENEIKPISSVIDSGVSLVSFDSCSYGVEEHCLKKFQNNSGTSLGTQGAQGSTDATVMDLFFKSHKLLVGTNDTQDINCLEDLGTLDVISSSEANASATSNGASQSGQKSEQDEANTVGYNDNLEPGGKQLNHQLCVDTSLECASSDTSRYCEDLKDSRREVSNEVDETDLEPESVQKSEQDEVNTSGYSNNLELPGGKQLQQQLCVDTCLECASGDTSRYCEDLKGSRREVSNVVDETDLEPENKHVLHQPCPDTFLECASANTSRDCEELKDFIREVNTVGGEKDSNLEREHALHTCPDIPVECEGPNTSGDYKDLKDSKTESILLQSSAKVIKGHSSCSDLDTLYSAALTSHEISPEDETFSYTDDELNSEQVKLEPEVSVPLKEIGNVKSMPELQLQPGPPMQCVSPHLQKPKRRLHPASSLLLKDISLFDVRDEMEKPKGAKGKTLQAGDKSRAPQASSSSLIDLLTAARFVR